MCGLADDNGTALGNWGVYNHDITSPEATRGEAGGWTFAVRLRIVDIPDPAGGQPAINFDSSP